MSHLFRRGDACKQKDVIVLEVFEFSEFSEISKDWIQLTILQCRKEKLLIRIEIHCLGDNTEFHRFQVFRTFRDDDDIGTVFPCQRLTESACWQQRVIDD